MITITGFHFNSLPILFYVPLANKAFLVFVCLFVCLFVSPQVRPNTIKFLSGSSPHFDNGKQLSSKEWKLEHWFEQLFEQKFPTRSSSDSHLEYSELASRVRFGHKQHFCKLNSWAKTNCLLQNCSQKVTQVKGWQSLADTLVLFLNKTIGFRGVSGDFLRVGRILKKNRPGSKFDQKHRIQISKLWRIH